MKEFEGHTPGPWTFSTITLHNPDRYTLLAGGSEVARIEDRELRHSGEANLQLIAAAPRLLAERDALLAACKSTEAFFYDQVMPLTHGVRAQVCAAITLCEQNSK